MEIRVRSIKNQCSLKLCEWGKQWFIEHQYVFKIANICKSYTSFMDIFV